MIVYLANKTQFRADLLKERGRLAHSYKFTSTGKLIDDALEAVEKENPKLKNVLVASVCDRRTLKSRVPGRQAYHSRPNRSRPTSRKTSDGRRPTLQLQIDPANLAGLAPAQPFGDAGLIDLIATIPFQHVDRNLSRRSAAKPDGGTIGDIMVFGQDQWAWGAHLRRAQRARRVRLRRKQPNQSNPTTWRLAAMNMAKSLPRQSETATGGLPRHSATTPGIDFDFGKEPADTFTCDQHPDLRADFVFSYRRKFRSSASF